MTARVVGLIPTALVSNVGQRERDGKLLYVSQCQIQCRPQSQSLPQQSCYRSGDRPCALAQQYMWQLEKGGLAVIPRPQPEELRALTHASGAQQSFRCANDAGKNRADERKAFRVPAQRIHHVIYIVKENRSYDQVLGDLEKGNGDPTLTLFPEAMTPNHHELARRFVTLDNFYTAAR